MATTNSCRNWARLLADYVAFTGRRRVGYGLDERRAGARWIRPVRAVRRKRITDAGAAAPP